MDTALVPTSLPEIADAAAFQQATTGWHWENGLLWVKLASRV